MDCLDPHHEATCPGMTLGLTITFAATLCFRLHFGGIRLHLVMLHRVLKAHGLGDAPVEGVLPADWVLLNLKYDADFPDLT